jgi:hypothetical protein
VDAPAAVAPAAAAAVPTAATPAVPQDAAAAAPAATAAANPQSNRSIRKGEDQLLALAVFDKKSRYKPSVIDLNHRMTINSWNTID